ncbi:hypothetical protein [Burkholderia sp. PU8-34]
MNEKPKSVRTAVNLLWASVAVGLVKVLLDFSYIRTVAPTALTNIVLIFVFAFISFLIFKISAGKNWARITFLVLFVIGVLPTLPVMFDEFSRLPVVGALSVAQIGLQIYALSILFTKPSSAWFRKVGPAMQ